MRRIFALSLLFAFVAAPALAGPNIPTGTKLTKGMTLVYRVFAGERTVFKDIYKPVDLPDYTFVHVTCAVTEAKGQADRFKVRCSDGAPDLFIADSAAFWHEGSTYGWTDKGLTRFGEGGPEVILPKAMKAQKAAGFVGQMMPLMGTKKRVQCRETQDNDGPGDPPDFAVCASLHYGITFVDATSVAGAGSFVKIELVDAFSTAAASDSAKRHKLVKKAQKFIVTWLHVQNKRNFKAYGELYSDKYKGVKRAGPKTRFFQKTNWLKDRAKMFKTAMKVQARDVGYTYTGEKIYVAFRQTWETKKWKDTGPKELVLKIEPTGLRAISEEMVESFRMK
jgi:hypothetical protein